MLCRCMTEQDLPDATRPKRFRIPIWPYLIDNDQTSITYTMTGTSTPKRGRANTQGESIIFSPEALAKSLEALRVDAEARFGTNPNLDPFSIVLQDGCEDAKDTSAYPDDSKLGTGTKYEEHTFRQDYPTLFINTPPGRRKSLFNILCC